MSKDVSRGPRPASRGRADGGAAKRLTMLGRPRCGAWSFGIPRSVAMDVVRGTEDGGLGQVIRSKEKRENEQEEVHGMPACEKIAAGKRRFRSCAVMMAD